MGAAIASGSLVRSGVRSAQVVIPMLVSPVVGVTLAFGLMLAIMWGFRRKNPHKVNRGFRFAQTVSAAAIQETSTDERCDWVSRAVPGVSRNCCRDDHVVGLRLRYHGECAYGHCPRALLRIVVVPDLDQVLVGIEDIERRARYLGHRPQRRGHACCRHRGRSRRTAIPAWRNRAKVASNSAAGMAKARW